MGLFDLFTNLNADELVKKVDTFEQALDSMIDKVNSATEKVETTAELVEQKLTPGTGATTAEADTEQ